MNAASLPLYRELTQKLQSGDVAAAKQGLPKLWLLAPGWPRCAHLEAYVHRAEGAYVSELKALNKMMSMLYLKDISHRDLAADGYSLMGGAYVMLGEIRPAVAAYLRAAELEINHGHRLDEVSNAIFAAHYAADFSAAEFDDLYDRYRRLLANYPRSPRTFFRHKRLRVGFLSGNYRQQPLAHFLLPLIRFLPRDKFALYGFNATEHSDGFTELLKCRFDHWQDVGHLQDEALASCIRQAEIDILLELDGHTKGNRLGVLACRPSAVQIFGLGYMGSTGLYDTDYFITDGACLSQRGSRAYLTETPLTVPGCHLCYDPISPLPSPATVSPCETNGYVTFGSLNNFSKVTDEMLSLWAQILRLVPHSRLLLKHRIFDSREGTEYVLSRMQQVGIESDSVELQGLSADYLSVYNNIDIALDTYPYTGALTTCEAMGMGVPVVTRYGERPGSAFGRTLLKAVGLESLVAANREEYVALAVTLAGKSELLTEIRRNLPQQIKQSLSEGGKNYADRVGLALLTAYNKERRLCHV